MIDAFKRMTKKRLIFFSVFLIFSILWGYMIFGFSGSEADKSLEQSGRFAKFVARLLEPDFDDMTSSQQEEAVMKYQRVVRKTAHFCAFALLGFLTYFCVGSIKFLPKGLYVQAAVSLPACVLFAMSDEYHQTFVAGRSGRLLDVGIDSCGAAAGTVFAIMLSLIYRYHISKKT